MRKHRTYFLDIWHDKIGIYDVDRPDGRDDQKSASHSPLLCRGAVCKKEKMSKTADPEFANMVTLIVFYEDFEFQNDFLIR